MDDFKDKIAQSSESEDEYGNKRKSKGRVGILVGNVDSMVYIL